jgi:hypothetical protein
MTQSLTRRIEDLEYTAAADMVGDYLFITRDDGKTFEGDNGTYTQDHLDQLEARGASITVISIVREAMAPMPEGVRLTAYLPDNGRD